MHMLLILLALYLRKTNGISHLFSITYAFAGNGCIFTENAPVGIKGIVSDQHLLRGIVVDN
jgi:hypothetical protein